MSQVESALARALVSRVYTLLSEAKDGAATDLDTGQRETVFWSQQTRLMGALRRAKFLSLKSLFQDWRKRHAHIDDAEEKASAEALTSQLIIWAELQLQPTAPPSRLAPTGADDADDEADEGGDGLSEFETRCVAEDLVWQEIVDVLAANTTLPATALTQSFHHAFSGNTRGMTGWFERYHLCVREVLKTDGALKLEVLVNLAAALGTSADTAKKGVARLLADTDVAAPVQPLHDAGAAPAPMAADYDAAMNTRMQKVWAALPASRGMPRLVLRAFLTELATMELADDAFPPLVERKLIEYQTLGKRWGTPTDSTTEHGRVWGQARATARAALEEGDLAGTHYAFAEASTALKELGSRHLRVEAEVLGEEAHALRLSWAYREAAARYQTAAERTATDPDAAAKWMQRSAEVLYLQGKEFGECAALRDAISIWRKRLDAMKREDLPLEWATTQNHLGNAFKSLGEIEHSSDHLKAAVSAYEEALLGSTRERAPHDWATTQHNLGNALTALAEHAELESNTLPLEKAVAAHQAALLEYTRENSPIPWAMTLIGLGNALKLLGEVENSVPRLQAAVDAYRSALQEYTRAMSPMHWAMTQNNLGSALLALGKRQHSTARLDESEAAYREALKERTRERAPMQWALTQNNLGNVLLARGKAGSDSARLNEAEAAYREALAERTQERAPHQWAMTQNNLGNALLAIGKLERNSTRLVDAAHAYREALKVRTPEHATLQWAMTQNNLANALCACYEATKEKTLLDDALTAIDGAIEKMQSTPQHLSVARRVRLRIVGLREPVAA